MNDLNSLCASQFSAHLAMVSVHYDGHYQGAKITATQNGDGNYWISLSG
jgi:hypothetical protein